MTEFGCDEDLVRQALVQARDASEQRRRSQRIRQRRGHRTAPLQSVTPDSPVDTIRRAYEERETEAYYHLDERGVVSEVDVIRVIYPLYSGVSLVWLNYSYYRDPSCVLSIDPGIGCTVASIRESRPGYISAVLRLDRSLDPQDERPHRLSYRVKVQSSIPCRPLLRYLAQPGRKRYALRVLFTPPALPREVWWFSERRLAETEKAVPTHPDRILPQNHAGFYFAEFRDSDEFHSGIAWAW